MTLRLGTPVLASASSATTCTYVASQTEFAVGVDPNGQLDTPEHPFLTMLFDVGDRWARRTAGPERSGVRLEIAGTDGIVSSPRATGRT